MQLPSRRTRRRPHGYSEEGHAEGRCHSGGCLWGLDGEIEVNYHLLWSLKRAVERRRWSYAGPCCNTSVHHLPKTSYYRLSVMLKWPYYQYLLWKPQNIFLIPDLLDVFQLSNQETVSSTLQMAGHELVVLMCDRLAQFEEAAFRQRAELEEERTLYLAEEERILTQLR